VGGRVSPVPPWLRHCAYLKKTSTKPEVRNILQCCQRLTEPRPQVTCRKFDGFLDMRAETHRHADHNTSHPYRGQRSKVFVTCVVYDSRLALTSKQCYHAIFDSVDLIKPVSNVRTYVRYAYDPIQGQGQSHEPFKVGNPAIFKSDLRQLLQWQLTIYSATDHRFLN